jgi:hypothetical protein
MKPSRQFRLLSLAGCVALLLSFAFAPRVLAQQAHSEDAVKAAYLYRFASYVEWPEQSVAGHPFIIDVMGDPNVARELRLLLPGHLINDQVVQVREVTRVRDVADAQMVYVGADHADFLRAMNSAGNPPILVVTDQEHGLDLGGVLNFVTVDNRVRFEISLTAAERAQLKISADLLSVAIRVHGGRRQSDEFCVPDSLPEGRDAPCGIRQARRLGQRPRGDDGQLLVRLDARSVKIQAGV